MVVALRFELRLSEDPVLQTGAANRIRVTTETGGKSES